MSGKRSRFAVDACIHHLESNGFEIAYTLADNDYSYAKGNRLGERPFDGASRMPTSNQLSRLVVLPAKNNTGTVVGILSTAPKHENTPA